MSMYKNSKARAGGRSQHEQYSEHNVKNAKILRSYQSISFTKTNGVKKISARDAKEEN